LSAWRAKAAAKLREIVLIILAPQHEVAAAPKVADLAGNGELW